MPKLSRLHKSISLVLCLLVFALFSCGGDGYKPPDKLVLPDPALCFKEGKISASKGGSLVIDMKECGSLRWSKVEFDADSLSADTTIRLATTDQIISDPSFILNYTIILEMISPQDTAIIGPVYITVPYVDSILVENNYTSVDASVFFKDSPLGTTSVIDQENNSKDEDAKKITTQITALGSYEPGVYVYSALGVGDTQRIDFSLSQGSFISEISGGEEFSIMLTALPTGLLFEPMVASSGSSTYTIDSSETAVTPSPKIFENRIIKTPLVSSKLNSSNNRQDIDLILQNKFLERLNRKQIVQNKLLLPSKKIVYENVPPNKGETATGFYVWDYSACIPYNSGCETLLFNQEGIIHKITDHGIFIVHNSTPTYYTSTMTAYQKSVIDLMADDFENIIYPRDTFFFGEPSDVDANDKIIIFFTNTLTSTGILGFYYSVDVFKNAGGYEDSNEADIIYSVVPTDSSVVPPDSIGKMLLGSIVAHEFQHLINFNNKTLKKFVGTGPLDSNLVTSSTPIETMFLNEGLSHFAEDIVGYADLTAGIPDILAEPNINYHPYLKNNWRSSLINTSGMGSYAMRGQNYLLVRYLFEQAGGATPLLPLVPQTANYTNTGGATFLKALIASDHVGVAGINSVFSDKDSLKRDFTHTYLDWLVTLFNDKYDDSINPSAKYNYNPTYKDAMNTSQTVGIDLDDTRTLEDSGLTVTMDGPTVFNFSSGSSNYSSTISNVGAAFVTYALPSSPSNDRLRFQILGDGNANLQGVIMRTK